MLIIMVKGTWLAVPSLNKILGINLRYYRYRENLSQEKYYSKYKLSIKHLANIERGKENVSLDCVERISQAINISSTDLLTYDENRLINKKRVDQKVVKK